MRTDRSLVPVEGTDQSFCSVTLVRAEYLCGVRRTTFPRSIMHLIRCISKDDSDTAKRQRTRVTLLTFCMNRFRNCVIQHYGPDWSYFLRDLNNAIKKIPRRFIEIEKYYPEHSPEDYSDYYIELVHISQAGIAWLEHKQEPITPVLKDLASNTRTENFEKYIEGWAEELLYGISGKGEIHEYMVKRNN